MHLLKSFHGYENHRVWAQIGFDPQHSDLLRIKFFLERKEDVIGLENKSCIFLRHECQRAQRLWSSTCFELFLKPEQEKHYYEFNWNTGGDWNVYRFDSYRMPQPPTENFEFILNKKSWDHEKKILEIELLNQSSYRVFQAGITVVLKDPKGQQDFLALAHPSKEADFHDERGFMLRLSNNI